MEIQQRNYRPPGCEKQVDISGSKMLCPYISIPCHNIISKIPLRMIITQCRPIYDKYTVVHVEQGTWGMLNWGHELELYDIDHRTH